MTSSVPVSESMLSLVWFLLRYWVYDFDKCCNVLARLDANIAKSEPNYNKYSKYQLDGYMYLATQCVAAVCNLGDPSFNSTSDECVECFDRFVSCLKSGRTFDPDTDPSKGLVPNDVVFKAGLALEALRYLNMCSVPKNKEDYNELRSQYTRSCKWLGLTSSDSENVVALGNLVTEAAATKLEISSS